MGMALEVAQNNHVTISCREAPEFLIEQVRKLAA